VLGRTISEAVNNEPVYDEQYRRRLQATCDYPLFVASLLLGGTLMTGPTHEEKRQIFERFLPGKLSHDEIDTLLHFARVESYPAGKEIYAKGSLGRSMMAVLRGMAKMTSVSRDGKEIVFNIMHPGEIFGEIALLDGGQRRQMRLR
jgi:Cyclic nucleotide-binding domain